MFFVTVFSIWALALVHIFLRTQQLLGLTGAVRILFGVSLLLVGFAYVPARILLATSPDGKLGGLLTLFGALVIGYTAILWTLVFVFDVGAAATWVVTRKGFGDLTPGTCQGMALALWGIAGVLGIVGFLYANSTPSVTKLDLTVPGAEAKRFVVISDAHLGVISLEGQWRRTLQAASELEPDALLIPGDLIDDRSSRAWSQVEMIRDFFPSLPVYVSTGNHEYYSGPREFQELSEKLQFRLLRQESMSLSPGLTVAGIDDLHFMPAARAIQLIRPKMEGAVLLLSHRPASVHELKDRPETLVVSGHTHGGQTLPVVFLVALGNGGFRSGHYPAGEAHLYVTRGTGVWGPPMRVLAPPEIVLIEVGPGEKFDVECRN